VTHRPERRLYIVRHGQTWLNADGRLRGHADDPLDDLGNRQADALATLFEGAGIARIVTSPLRRAHQTADAIAAATRAPLAVDPRFRDRDWGPWTGHVRQDVETRFAGVDQAPGIEPTATLARRVVAAARELLLDDDAIMLVAHDAVNRAALAALCDNTPADPRSIPQRTGCWNRVERQPPQVLATVVDACPGDGQQP
jgi:broad specificity phosphatase PhoE